MKMSLKEGQAYAALRDAVASQIQEMKVTPFALGLLFLQTRHVHGQSCFVLCNVAMPFVTSSFLLLAVRPGAPSSGFAPSSDALCS